MSTHSVNVIRIKEVLPHPNADKLEVVNVGEYTCLVPKGSFAAGSLAAYIEPDYVVPDSPEFAFLAGKRRIGAKRLRGVWSEGLLVRAPEGSQEGDNVMEQMGITRWEPPEPGQPGWCGVKGPPLGCLESVPDFIKGIPKYDLENLKRHVHLFEKGEPCIVTEKLHGTNARYVFHDGRMYCGSRTQWRKEEPTNVYWEALKQNRWVEGYCKAYPDYVVCGEIFGDVQDLKYGAQKGQYEFRVFDVMFPRIGGGHHYMDWYALPPQLNTVPVVTTVTTLTVPFDMEVLKELAEKDSVFGGIREGLVIQPEVPRYDMKIGRVKLKLVSNRYLSR